MRICAIEFFGRGGILHYVHQLCRALAAQDAEVKLITAQDYELADRPHNFAVEKLFRLWDPRQGKSVGRWTRLVTRAGRALIYYREWWRLIRYLRRERPDVALFGEIRFPTDLLPLLLLRLSRVPLADICHDVVPFDLRSGSTEIVATSPLSRLLYRRIYRCFRHVFVHSQINREQFIRAYGLGGKVHVIPHGNEQLFVESAAPASLHGTLRQKLSLPEGAPVALFFGTLSKYKGVEYLLEAFAGVRRALPAARLVVAGYPDQDIDIGALRQRAANLAIADAVVFHLEYVPNEQVGAFFDLADVVVFPYVHVYQSGALQLAYSFGKAVVATRVGGLPEVVREGETGLLVPPRDSAALGVALIALLSDRPLTHRLGRQARAWSETHSSWNEIASRVLAVLRNAA